MNPPQSSRDRQLAELLKNADHRPAVSPRQIAALNSRILAAAAPMLGDREARNRTLWDYAEHWSSMLLPLGMLTAVAAAMCLFVLSMHREPVDAPLSAAALVTAPGPRVALMGAATNRVSSQRLVDILVSVDGSSVTGRGSR